MFCVFLQTVMDLHGSVLPDERNYYILSKLYFQFSLKIKKSNSAVKIMCKNFSNIVKYNYTFSCYLDYLIYAFM